ncbi:MDR family MFS transporter [Pseudomonas citronellolis]|uniref:MDR family MFS transporter n=2 Tax=Pseudomonas citronellolis TaxID=53408 RepID=UPI002FD97CF0
MNTLSHPRPPVRTILIGLMLAIFLGALDQTIVAVSLPAISAGFANFDLLAWVISGYMVAMTISMPIYGKLGDLYGRRRLMLFATALFTFASLLCGLAQSMEQLVLARVLQGVGAGGLMSVSQAIIGDIVPPRERGRYQGYFSSMYAVASIAGPVLGGLLTEYLSWRWVFLINLPVGLVAFAVSRRTLVGLPVPGRRPRIDYLGTLLMIAGLGSLLLAITDVGQGADWRDAQLLGLFAAALVLLVLFVLQERRAAEPLVPMQLFAIRAATLSWMVGFFASFQIISLSVLVPLRFQSVTGAGADSAALHMLPLAMGVPIGAYCCGRLTTILGRYKPQIVAGALLLPCAVAGLALATPSSFWLSGLFMLLCGTAAGTQFPTSLVAAQSAVSHSHLGVATSNTTLFRSLGGAVGVALMSAILLAMLQPLAAGQGFGHGISANELLASLAGPGHEDRRLLLDEVFRRLFLVNAGVGVLALLIALALPNSRLRGKVED